MLRRFLTLILLLTWAITACGGGSSSVSGESQIAATQTLSSQMSQDVSTAREPGCSVVGSQPTPGPTEQAIIPKPSSKDWIKGAEDAYITFIEYSDFQ